MTEENKVRVTALRNQGYGYLKIANQLGISLGSVKSFCQRCGLRKTPQSMSKKPSQPKSNASDSLDALASLETRCKQCGKPILQPPHAKKKLFCSTSCRYKWWNAHPESGSHRTVHQFTCLTCGTPFESYQKNRKFCCTECYVKSRYKESSGRENT